MKLELSKNIQRYRKKKKLTQEQLAEALGVTVGAVSKWENGLSNPDISMIVELAAYFEVSIDVLFGYEVTKESAGKAADEVHRLYKKRQLREAKEVMEKALVKYPNHFQLNYLAGVIENACGMEYEDEEAYRRSIHYYERALDLFDQNEDEKISTIGIEAAIAENYGELKEYKEAVRRLKKDNPMGINNVKIGIMYVCMDEYEKAEKILKDALVEIIARVISSVTMMNNVHIHKKEYEKIIKAVDWMEGWIRGMMEPGEINYFTRILAINECFRGYAVMSMGEEQLAKESLKKSLRLSTQFEMAGNFSMNISFLGENDGVVFDDIKKGDGFIEDMIEDWKSDPEYYQRLRKMYEEVKEEVKNEFEAG